MPFKSEAQRRKFHAMASRGEISRKTVKDWERHTKDKDLPEKVSSVDLERVKMAAFADELRKLAEVGALPKTAQIATSLGKSVGKLLGGGGRAAGARVTGTAARAPRVPMKPRTGAMPQKVVPPPTPAAPSGVQALKGRRGSPTGGAPTQVLNLPKIPATSTTPFPGAAGGAQLRRELADPARRRGALAFI